MSASPRQQTIDDLSRKLRQWERSTLPVRQPDDVLSTGLAPLDDLLPERGVPPGTLIEWLSTAEGSGAETLAMVVAGHTMGEKGVCIVIDRGGSFYPPAATPWIEDLQRMLVVHPNSDRDALWALEQSLRCSGVAVVVCRVEKLSQEAWRRLQLAGETGGGLGLLLRSAQQRAQPSWAGVRLLVEPLPTEPGGRGSRRAEGRDKETRRQGDKEQDKSAITKFSLSPDSLVPLSEPNSKSAFASCEEFLSVSGVGIKESSPGRRIRIELIHCRGRTQGGSVELEIDDETGDVHLAPSLAPAARRLRASS